MSDEDGNKSEENENTVEDVKEHDVASECPGLRLEDS